MIERNRENVSNGTHMASMGLPQNCDECGKSASQVKELIIGNGECICDQCLRTTDKPLFVAYRDGELQ